MRSQEHYWAKVMWDIRWNQSYMPQTDGCYTTIGVVYSLWHVRVTT